MSRVSRADGRPGAEVDHGGLLVKALSAARIRSARMHRRQTRTKCFTSLAATRLDDGIGRYLGAGRRDERVLHPAGAPGILRTRQRPRDVPTPRSRQLACPSGMRVCSATRWHFVPDAAVAPRCREIRRLVPGHGPDERPGMATVVPLEGGHAVCDVRLVAHSHAYVDRKCGDDSRDHVRPKRVERLQDARTAEHAGELVQPVRIAGAQSAQLGRGGLASYYFAITPERPPEMSAAVRSHLRAPNHPGARLAPGGPVRGGEPRRARQAGSHDEVPPGGEPLRGPRGHRDDNDSG